MLVSYIKCDICYEENVKHSEKYYVETRTSERVCEQYDICDKCMERFEELIKNIREEKNKPF